MLLGQTVLMSSDQRQLRSLLGESAGTCLQYLSDCDIEIGYCSVLVGMFSWRMSRERVSARRT